MKKALLLVFACAIHLFSFAQITIVSGDMPVPVATLYNAVDTLPTVTPGAAGANQTWNLAGIGHILTDTVRHKLPSSTAYASTFSTATDAATTTGTQYAFFKNSSATFTAQGLAGDLLNNGGSLAVTFNPTYDVYRFPTQYNGNYNGTYGFIDTVSGSSVGQPLVYQVRLTYTAVYTDTIDGWGSCITPLGSYNTLRQKHKEFTHTLAQYKLTALSSWTTASDTRDTTLTYAWLAKESKGPVASISINKRGVVTRASYSLTPPKPIASFTYHIVSGGQVQFTNTSQNNPTSYAWAFGDGGTSTTTNPTHTYTASGTYNVCLVATNSSGSDTACTTITVNISAPYYAEINGSADLCANQLNGIAYSDSVRAGNSYTWTVTGGSIASGAGTHSITVNWNSTGNHSLQLIECNSGNTYCDTTSLTINIMALPTSTISHSICSGDSYLGHNTTGTFVDTLTAAGANGCDSIRTLNLTVSALLTDTARATICQGDSYEGHTAAGTYTDTLQSTGGCDSLHILILTVNPLPVPTVTQTGDTLSTQTFASYQWYMDGALLTDDTAQTLALTQNGNYTVWVTDANGCSDSAVAINVVGVGINEVANQDGITLFPNPNSGQFVLTIAQPVQQLKLELLNMAGQVLYSEQWKDQAPLRKELNFKYLAKGVYLLKIGSEKGVVVKRMLVE